MKFLLDQNADRRFATYLRSLGHDVTVVSIDYPHSLPDHEILAIAVREGRVIITNDPDFGELVVRHGQPHAGIIYMRVRQADYATKQARLEYVLTHHAHELDQLIVVTLQAVRVRRTPPTRPA
jgi:predicted nuclease of predicted toxin-antitoxin system